MNAIQEKMYHVYKQVKEICELHNLRFYAAGGTKIGAVLWNGIIPWDDDIDLVMPLEDLRRLVAIISNNTFENLSVFDGLTEPYSDIVGVKVFNTQTMFTSHNLLNRPESFTGVFVDIFPMIGSPAHSNDFITELNLLRDELFKQRLFGKSVEKTRVLLEQLREIMERYSFDESEFVMNVANPVAETFLKEEFLDTIDMQFETTSVPVSRYYDSHLKQQYGSYTKDWPECKRIQAHEQFALVDLNRGIKDYQDAIFVSPINNYITKLGEIKSDLESQIFAIDDKRKRIEDTNRCLEAELNEILVVKKDLELDILKKDREIQAYQTSFSWRITKPVRSISGILKRLKHKLCEGK